MLSKSLVRTLVMAESFHQWLVSSSRNNSVYAFICIYAKEMSNRDSLTVLGEKILECSKVNSKMIATVLNV